MSSKERYQASRKTLAKFDKHIEDAINEFGERVKEVHKKGDVNAMFELIGLMSYLNSRANDIAALAFKLAHGNTKFAELDITQRMAMVDAWMRVFTTSLYEDLKKWVVDDFQKIYNDSEKANGKSN